MYISAHVSGGRASSPLDPSEERTHIGTDAESGHGKLVELIELMEIDAEALKEAEFFQVQSILDTLVGKSIAAATMEETRIVVETAEGDRYFFYGFMGSGNTRPEPSRT